MLSTESWDAEMIWLHFLSLSQISPLWNNDFGRWESEREKRKEGGGKWKSEREPEKKIRFHIPSSFSHTAYFALSLIVTWFLRSNDFYYIAIWTMNNWIWARKFATNWTGASFPNSSKPNHRFALLTFSSPDVGSQSLISSILLFFSLSSRSGISSFSSSVIPFRYSFFLFHLIQHLSDGYGIIESVNRLPVIVLLWLLWVPISPTHHSIR